MIPPLRCYTFVNPNIFINAVDFSHLTPPVQHIDMLTLEKLFSTRLLNLESVNSISNLDLISSSVNREDMFLLI